MVEGRTGGLDEEEGGVGAGSAGTDMPLRGTVLGALGISKDSKGLGATGTKGVAAVCGSDVLILWRL